MNMLSTNGATLSIAIADFAFVVTHLGLFVLLRRKNGTIRQERGIFLYHAVFFILGVVGATVASIVVDGTLDIRAPIIVAALQGVYSMTFLEAWSLSEGSYSYSILRQINSDGMPDTTSLETIGAGKRIARSDGLIKLGLLDRSEDEIAITTRGRITAQLLVFALWLINLKRHG